MGIVWFVGHRTTSKYAPSRPPRRHGEHIKQIKSIHNNHREDRLWEAICGKLPGIKADRSCKWSGYVNGFDETIAFTCPAGTVMTGMSSYHDNRREDRRFNFYCCATRAETIINCPTGRCGAGKYGASCQFDNKCYFGKREEYMG